MKLLSSRFGTLSNIALLIGSTFALELMTSPLSPQASALPPVVNRITVNTTNDSGAGSLRQAVLDANASPGADEIVFNLAGNDTITLTSGQIDIADALTIKGPGRDRLKITGNNARRLFRVNLNANVKMQGLTISNSKTTGSVIGNFGKLEIRDSAFRSNRGEKEGTIENGSATDSATDIKLNLENVLFISNTGNFGGALINFATATLRRCNFHKNASSLGGAIQNQDSATLRVEQSTFTQNHSKTGGGGIFNEGNLTVVGGSFIANVAGQDGGGIFNRGTATLQESIFQLNTATKTGGGIFSAGGTVQVTRSQIRQNTASVGPDVSGAFVSQGNNEIGNATGSTGFANGAAGDRISSN